MPLTKKQIFNVTLEWKNDHEMVLHTRDIPDIIVGPPVTFGGKPHYTIAQDLFLGSIATCLTSTFITVAKLKHLEFNMLKTEVAGVLEILSKDDVRFTEVSTTMHLAINNKADAGVAKSAHKKTADTCVIDLTIKDALPMFHHLKLYLPE